MIRREDRAVETGGINRFEVDRLVAASALLELRHVWIRIADNRAAVDEQLDDVQRRRFPNIADVLLVRDPAKMNPRTLDWFADGVESIADASDHIFRHRGVHMSGQLDEPALEAVLPRLPRKIVRVNGDAVAAETRPRVERHEAERLR